MYIFQVPSSLISTHNQVKLKNGNRAPIDSEEKKTEQVVSSDPRGMDDRVYLLIIRFQMRFLKTFP